MRVSERVPRSRGSRVLNQTPAPWFRGRGSLARDVKGRDVRVRKQFSFEAAHVLPHHPGKCSRPHGHSYRLDVAVDGALHAAGPAAGMVVDFDWIGEVVERDVIGHLDHRSLNDVVQNPTSERVGIWIWRRLAPALPGLAEVVLWETATACAVVRAEDAAEEPAAV